MKKMVKTCTHILIVFLMTGSLLSAVPKQPEKSLLKIETLFSENNKSIPDNVDRYLANLKNHHTSSKTVLSKSMQADATIIQVLYQEWLDGVWVNSYRDTETFDENSMLISNWVSEKWDGSQWVLDSRMNISLDDKGNIVEMFFEDYINAVWLPSLKMTYTYDADGNELTSLTQADENQDGTLVNSFKTENTFDANGYLIVEKSFIWDSGSWMEISTSTYTNDNTGRPIEKIDSMDIGYGEPFLVGRTTYEYTAGGNLSTETEYNVDYVTEGWTPSARYLYAYNALGLETEIISQTWDGSTWVNQDRDSMTYDAHGNETLWLYQSWDGSQWANNERITSTIGANNKPSEMIWQSWNGSWQNVERWTITYKTGTNIATEITAVPTAFTLTNYPNPFNPVTVISFHLPQASVTSLSIFDTNGRLVKDLLQSEHLQAGQHEMTWDGTDSRQQKVAAGVYFYKVESEFFQATSRCVLLK